MSMYEEVREVSNLLELELQTAMSHLIWVLGIEPRSPARTVCALEPWASCPTLVLGVLISASTSAACIPHWTYANTIILPALAATGHGCACCACVSGPHRRMQKSERDELRSPGWECSETWRHPYPGGPQRYCGERRRHKGHMKTQEIAHLGIIIQQLHTSECFNFPTVSSSVTICFKASKWERMGVSFKEQKKQVRPRPTLQTLCWGSRQNPGVNFWGKVNRLWSYIPG